jgi:hypothetical protein
MSRLLILKPVVVIVALGVMLPGCKGDSSTSAPEPKQATRTSTHTVSVGVAIGVNESGTPVPKSLSVRTDDGAPSIIELNSNDLNSKAGANGAKPEPNQVDSSDSPQASQ